MKSVESRQRPGAKQMEKENVEKLLKVEIDLFKVYSFFLAGLIAGDVNFLLKYFAEKEEIILYLLIIGLVALVYSAYLVMKTFIIIIKLKKEFKK